VQRTGIFVAQYVKETPKGAAHRNFVLVTVRCTFEIVINGYYYKYFAALPLFRRSKFMKQLITKPIFTIKK
jgi:hypothetical protein